MPRTLCRSQHLILLSELLSDSSSIQEILWNFCRFKDENQRLTLKENPHFYEDLPFSRAARGSAKIGPTNDFRRSNKFYVLTDKQELVHIMTDEVSQSFGNFWFSQNGIIFKGLDIPPPLPRFLMPCQTSMGRSQGETS